MCNASFSSPLIFSPADSSLLLPSPAISMSMSMLIVYLYSTYNREAPNALCTLVEREKKSFQVNPCDVVRYFLVLQIPVTVYITRDLERRVMQLNR